MDKISDETPTCDECYEAAVATCMHPKCEETKNLCVLHLDQHSNRKSTAAHKVVLKVLKRLKKNATVCCDDCSDPAIAVCTHSKCDDVKHMCESHEKQHRLRKSTAAHNVLTLDEALQLDDGDPKGQTPEYDNVGDTAVGEEDLLRDEATEAVLRNTKSTPY